MFIHINFNWSFKALTECETNINRMNVYVKAIQFSFEEVMYKLKLNFQDDKSCTRVFWNCRDYVSRT